MRPAEIAHNAGIEKSAQVADTLMQLAAEKGDQRTVMVAEAIAEQIRNLKIGGQ